MSGIAGGFPPPPTCLACGRVIRRAVLLNGGAPALMCDGCHEGSEARLQNDEPSNQEQPA